MYIEFLIQFFAAWFKSRRIRNLALMGSAVFSLPLLAVGFVLWGYSTSANTVYATCMEVVNENLESDRDESVVGVSERADEIRVPLRRVLQLGKSNERVVFEVAAQLGREGRLYEAIRKMREIAPAGERGFPRAHAWLANVTLLYGARAAPEERAALLNDLEIAESSMASLPPELTAVYVEHLVKTGEGSKALSVLRTRAQQEPSLDLMLARLATALGQRSDARDACERVEAAIDADYESKVKDEAYYLRKAEIEQFSGDREQLLALVIEGLAAFPGSEQLRRAHAELVLVKLEDIGDATPETASQRIARIKSAFDIDPQSPSVLTMIAFEMQSGTDVPEELRAGLLKSFQDGTAPPEAKFIIANLMLTTGKSGGAKSAIALFVSAVQSGNASAALLNNLAYALLQIEEPNVSGALQLIDQALSVPQLSESAAASIYDTQGDAREMNNDLTGAIESYERAVELVATKINSRQKLAALYGKLGMTDLASGQLKLIEKLKEEASNR